MIGPLTRAETRRIAEIQISVKKIDFDIQATSCAQEAAPHQARRGGGGVAFDHGFGFEPLVRALDR